jgi:uncharacterized protein (TIGR00255 family)
MHSMTGYGRGEAANGAVRFTVELQSVNRKHIDIALSLPRSLQPIESRLREKVQARIARGRVNVAVSITPSGDASATQCIDEALARLYANSMRRLMEELNLSGGLTLETLLRAPGVLLSPGQDLDAEKAWPTLEQALDCALEELTSMRHTEGTTLSKDLAARLAKLSELVSLIQERGPQITQNYRAQLLERLKAADLDVSLTDERLLKELALFADRSDITEEIDRARIHTRQFQQKLDDAQPVGRTLEFLVQELGREFNTIASKSQSAAVAALVIEAKTALDRLREQIANIE